MESPGFLVIEGWFIADLRFFWAEIFWRLRALAVFDAAEFSVLLPARTTNRSFSARRRGLCPSLSLAGARAD